MTEHQTMSSEGLTAESEKLARLWMIERTVRYAAQPASGALDVERLARAMVNIRPYGGNPDAWALVAARRVAAEYTRLAHPDTAGEPGEAT